MALFIWYSIRYSLNHFNALPIKNIPVYITMSTSVTILSPLYLSFNGIYVKYPLSLIFILLNHLITNNLIFFVLMLFSLLLKAS